MASTFFSGHKILSTRRHLDQSGACLNSKGSLRLGTPGWATIPEPHATTESGHGPQAIHPGITECPASLTEHGAEKLVRAGLSGRGTEGVEV